MCAELGLSGADGPTAAAHDVHGVHSQMQQRWRLADLPAARAGMTPKLLKTFVDEIVAKAIGKRQ
jgi:hypothetical protein